MRTMQIETVALSLARPFMRSHDVRNVINVVRITLEKQGFIGLGECTPAADEQESAASLTQQLDTVRADVERGLSLAELQAALPPGAARNALDCALWRLNATLQKQTLWQHLGMLSPASLLTTETLSLDTLENMVIAAADAVSRGARVIKLKLDRNDIIEKVAAIRAVAPRATLMIDANASWSGLDVGESGSGKSVTSLTAMGLLASSATIERGRITFHSRHNQRHELLSLKEDARRQLRGRDMAMIFQEPMISLNPVLKVSDQLTEALRDHHLCDAATAEKKARELLRKVRIADVDRVMKSYPASLSGGMRQRIANRVAVMYLDQIVEIGPHQAVFNNPQHPYTQRLLASVPIADPTQRSVRQFDDSEIPSPLRKAGETVSKTTYREVGPRHWVTTEPYRFCGRELSPGTQAARSLFPMEA